MLGKKLSRPGGLFLLSVSFSTLEKATRFHGGIVRWMPHLVENNAVIPSLTIICLRWLGPVGDLGCCLVRKCSYESISGAQDLFRIYLAPWKCSYVGICIGRD